MFELEVYHIAWCLWCKPPGNLVCTYDVIGVRSHSSDYRKMAEYMVRHSSVSLSVISFSTQNILELHFWKVKGNILVNHWSPIHYGGCVSL